jgi:hypothetical protein
MKAILTGLIALAIAAATGEARAQETSGDNRSVISQPTYFWRDGQWQTYQNGQWTPYGRRHSAPLQHRRLSDPLPDVNNGAANNLGQRHGIGQPNTGIGRPPGGLGQPGPTLGQPAPGLGRPPNGLGQPPTGLGQPPTGLGRNTIGIGQPSGGLGRPSGGIGQTTIGIGQPTIGIGQPNGTPPPQATLPDTDPTGKSPGIRPHRK